MLPFAEALECFKMIYAALPLPFKSFIVMALMVALGLNILKILTERT